MKNGGADVRARPHLKLVYAHTRTKISEKIAQKSPHPLMLTNSLTLKLKL